MANTSSISLVNLDFDTLKDSLKSYLKNQNQFSDVDFDGSNISVLLDILTYNTYMNVFYLNQVGSESFLDSAKLRDSIVSHAKELNYTPRSFTSSQATVNLAITSSDTNKTSITIPKGTGFVGRIGSNNYIFTTNENIVTSGATNFHVNNVEIFEGSYLTESFNSEDDVIISNENVDINSLSVYVVEDNGGTVYEYLRAASLFGQSGSSLIYFVQAAQGGKYQIIFGDDVIGRAPKSNSTVIVEYRISNGELANNIQKFTPIGAIDGDSNIIVTTVKASHSGTVAESDESIKYNAPRHFTTQERAVTAEDYENLLKENFPEINAVTAFGGEELNPPKYGKVFVSVDLNDIDSLPSSKKDQFYTFLKNRSPLSITPVFIEPEYLYVQVFSSVTYNVNLTSKSLNDIRSQVIDSILQYARTNLNDFAKTLRYSRLVESIDAADISIISNITSVKAVKNIDVVKLVNFPVNIELGFKISKLESTDFLFKGISAKFVDDGLGAINISTPNGLTKIGIVDYSTGSIQINSFVASATNNTIRLIIVPVESDVSSFKNTVINIIDSDIIPTIIQARE